MVRLNFNLDFYVSIILMLVGQHIGSPMFVICGVLFGVIGVIREYKVHLFKQAYLRLERDIKNDKR